MQSTHLTLAAVAALAAAGAARRRGSAARDLTTEDYSETVSGPKGQVRFGPQGIASVPSVRNIEYLGFMVWMRPSEFLRLNPVRDNDPAWMKEHIESGREIGVPFIDARLTDDSYDDDGLPLKSGITFQVTGHEGRTRMRAIQAVVGDVEVPVAVLVRYMRARHFTPEGITGAAFLPDKRSLWGRSDADAEPFRVRRFALAGREYP
jgi:hypothetical protein